MSVELSPEQVARVRVFGIFDDERRREVYVAGMLAGAEERLGVRLDEWPPVRAHLLIVHGDPDAAGLEAVERFVRDAIVARLRALEGEARSEAFELTKRLLGGGPVDERALVEREQWGARAAAFAAAADVAAGVIL